MSLIPPKLKFFSHQLDATSSHLSIILCYTQFPPFSTVNILGLSLKQTLNRKFHISSQIKYYSLRLGICNVSNSLYFKQKLLKINWRFVRPFCDMSTHISFLGKTNSPFSSHHLSSYRISIIFKTKSHFFISSHLFEFFSIQQQSISS